MMESLQDDDITAVFEMKKGFHSSLGQRTDCNLRYSGHSTTQSSLSMDQFMEKERKERERQAELIEMRTKVTRLQQQITMLQTEQEQLSVQHEKELLRLSRCHSNDNRALSTLKDQLHQLLTKDEETQTKLDDTQAELTQNKAMYEQKILVIQKEKYQLQTDIQELQHEFHTRQQDMRKDNMMKDAEFNICQLELRETKQQLQHAVKRCNTTSSQLQESDEMRLRALKAEQHVKHMEGILSELEGERTITRTMKDKLDRLKNLESENCKLKSENLYCKQTQDNVFLLREEVNGLKKKLERAELRCVEYSQLLIESKDLQEKLDKWEKLSDESSKRLLTPQELSQRISDLQHSNASLLERQGLLQSSVHCLEETLNKKAHEFEVVETKLSNEHAGSKDKEQLIIRLKRKLLLVSKERDGYKNILDSFEREHTSNVALANQRRNVQQLQDTMQGYQRHITTLENEIEDKEQDFTQATERSRQLETDLNHLRQIQPSFSAEADSKVILQLREQVVSLEKVLLEVQEERADLKLRLDRAHIQGIYEPENTKIVTLTLNPFNLARKRRLDEIESMMEDNKRLRTRVELIEENHGDLDDITQQVSQKLQQSGVDSQQIQEFQDKIHSAELKNQRLMEVFKKKSHELREIVYRLLGYMIKIPCDNQYSLINMYADSPDDFLLFQKSTSGDLQLLESEYSKTLSDRMETYLAGHNSIPAFLSSLTMELFSHQTI